MKANIIFIFILCTCCMCHVQVQAQSYIGADSLIYTPTDMVNNICMVTGICSPRKQLTIPDEIEIKGRKFTVNQIGRSAFGVVSSFAQLRTKGNTKYVYVGNNVSKIGAQAFAYLGKGVNNIRQVILGEKVSFIDEYAFQGCQLKVIVSLNPTPPTIKNEDCFYSYRAGKSSDGHFYYTDAFDNCVVYVPDASVDKYRKNYMWAKFWTIKGLSELEKDKNYMTPEKIRDEILLDRAIDDSIATAQRYLEANRKLLEPRIQKSIKFVSFVGAVIQATNKSKLKGLSENSSGHYDLVFEKGENILDIDFSKKVTGKWTDVVDVNYQCQYDPIKNVVLVLVSRTLVSKNASGEESKHEERRIFLINNEDVHKIDKKLQTELMRKFFSNIKN